MTRNYIWTHMNKDINKWCESCLDCQKAKVNRHTVSLIGIFSPAQRFSHVHIDIVGPLPPSNGKRYILTIIDRCTSWPEAFPISDISAKTVAKKLYEGWITRFGCPDKITTDQGRQFESEVFTNLAKLMGIERIRTTAYHPQSNGMIERWHRNLKAALIARGNTNNWVKELPTIIFGLRNCPRQDTGYSAAEMVFGTALKSTS